MNISDPSQPTGTLAGSKADFWALMFAIAFPSIVTLVYFQILAGVQPAIQQTAYGIGKVLQFVFPIAWIWLFYRYRLQRPSPPANASADQRPKTDYWLAIAFGVLVVLTMGVLFFLVIQPTPAGERLVMAVREKIDSMGLRETWKYVAVGCFYTVMHSLLEEYYWRWFVYDLGKKFWSPMISNFVSSLGFAAHHVILLGFFFGWASPWTYIISLAIAVGGSVWAGMYQRSGVLWPAWLSHAIVDAGIFSLGYIIWRG